MDSSYCYESHRKPLKNTPPHIHPPYQNPQTFGPGSPEGRALGGQDAVVVGGLTSTFLSLHTEPGLRWSRPRGPCPQSSPVPGSLCAQVQQCPPRGLCQVKGGLKKRGRGGARTSYES